LAGNALTGGSSIGLLPTSMKERLSAALPTVQAHSSKFYFAFPLSRICTLYFLFIILLLL